MPEQRRPGRFVALVRVVLWQPIGWAVGLLRLVVLVLLPVAWLSALAFARAPRWWRALAVPALRLGELSRGYLWLLRDDAPYGRVAPGAFVAPRPVRIPRKSVLGRIPYGSFLVLIRVAAVGIATPLSMATWACKVFARRHPRRMAAVQWTLHGLVGDIDAYLLLLTPARPRLPEPDPRLKPGGRPGPDAAPLPPWPRRIGWIALGSGILIVPTVSSFAVWGDPPLGFELGADLVIQGLMPWLAIYIAASVAPLAAWQLGLHHLRPIRSFGWSAALVGCYVAITSSLTFAVFGPFGADKNDNGGIVPDHIGVAWTLVFLALATVIAPLFEETFYRGFVFQALRAGRGTWVAAGLSSLGFAIAHFDFNPIAIVDRTLLGVGLCWVFARSGRLLPGMYVHSLNNAIVLPLAIGWDWQILLVVPASWAIIALVATIVARTRGELTIAVE